MRILFILLLSWQAMKVKKTVWITGSRSSFSINDEDNNYDDGTVDDVVEANDKESSNESK
jgi:hypothetical protein